MFNSYKFFIFTEDPDELVKFYTEALGWGIVRKLEYDLDYGYTLEISPGGMQVWLAQHSEVKGSNKDPYRHLMNLYTDKLEYYLERVRSYPGAKVIAEPFSMGEIIPGEKRWCCTVLDPEGNCLQFMGEKN
jgi:predicted enzyme related to lactoylglutathione lyase